jgi:hypothetical protein
MVTWLAGNRIRGTTAERPALGLPSGSVGGWTELARATGTQPDVTSIADKRYYMILVSMLTSNGDAQLGLRVGNSTIDTGSNYAKRQSQNGATDSTAVSQTSIGSMTDTLGIEQTAPYFAVGNIANLSSKEKLFNFHTVIARGGTGAGNIPTRSEVVGKWANTSNVIDRIQAIASGGAFTSASEMVVLGWDPADTHTTNFWEELASVELGSTNINLDSGTFTAKKYLWVQMMMYPNGGANTNFDMTFNSDTGSNYARRSSTNGATDATNVSQTSLQLWYQSNKPRFYNMFIINNSANEKLAIVNLAEEGTAGAANAPDRVEYVFKWANTSAQITSINVGAGSGKLHAVGSIMKVWGSN